MDNKCLNSEKHYRLVLSEDGKGVSRVFEFEASDAESVLSTVWRHGEGRPVSVFEDGALLATLRLEADGNWTISQSRSHGSDSVAHRQPVRGGADHDVRDCSTAICPAVGFDATLVNGGFEWTGATPIRKPPA